MLYGVGEGPLLEWRVMFKAVINAHDHHEIGMFDTYEKAAEFMWKYGLKAFETYPADGKRLFREYYAPANLDPVKDKGVIEDYENFNYIEERHLKD